MHDPHHHSDPSDTPTPFSKSAVGVALIMLALVVGFYLIREHWSHLGQTWPYLLLLLCPVMHLFMHNGHGHSRHNGHSRKFQDKDGSHDT